MDDVSDFGQLCLLNTTITKYHSIHKSQLIRNSPTEKLSLLHRFTDFTVIDKTNIEIDFLISTAKKNDL